jgi:type I restriction enzyme S subunit
MAKWNRSPLGAVTDLCLGKMLDQEKNRGEPLPYLANVNVRWGEFALDNLRTMRFEPHERERYGLRHGDIVMCEGGEPGRCAIWRDQVPGMMIQKALHRIRPRDILDYRFLYYNLLNIGNSKGFDQYFTGATIKHLPGEKLAKVEVDIPPLPVQRRIAGILSAYDELIENSQRRIRILETMARALYREWFVNFRFPGHEKVKLVASSLGEIPEGWGIKPVQCFGKVITGKTPSKANADFYGDDVPFVKTPDMHGNMFIITTNESLSVVGAKSQSNKTLPAGTICVSCIGTIGVVSITTEDCQTNQQINSVLLEKEVGREFLFLRLQDAKQTLENLGANGATMGNVNKGKFEAMEIVAPPPRLLADYHLLAQPMFEEILALSRQTQNLRRTRDLLLPRLLSGQVNLKEY